MKMDRLAAHLFELEEGGIEVSRFVEYQIAYDGHLIAADDQRIRPFRLHGVRLAARQPRSKRRWFLIRHSGLINLRRRDFKWNLQPRQQLAPIWRGRSENELGGDGLLHGFAC